MCLTWVWQFFRTPLTPLSYRGDGRQHCSGRKCGKTDHSDSETIGKCIRSTYGLPTSNVSTNVVSMAACRLNGIGACRRPLCHFRKRRLNPLTRGLIVYEPQVGLDDTWLPLVGRTCLGPCVSLTRLAALLLLYSVLTSPSSPPFTTTSTVMLPLSLKSGKSMVPEFHRLTKYYSLVVSLGLLRCPLFGSEKSVNY